MDEPQLLKGRLLVAAPSLVDSSFFRTVVLVVEHHSEGSAGVVLNRPTQTTLDEGPLECWADVAADPPLVFFGGPVSETAAVCLARARPDADPVHGRDGFEPVIDRVGVLDIGRDAAELRPWVDRIRVFAGYAGWGAGQLEREIDEGAWYVLDADPGDVLSPEPGGLWRVVLQRQGGTLALVASFPADPTMN